MNIATVKIAIVQRICPHYRQPFFAALSQLPWVDLTLLTTDPKRPLGLQESSYKWINYPALPVFFSWGVKSYSIPISFALWSAVMRANYDVIVAEGVTNILNDVFLFPICKTKGISFIWWDAGRRRNSPKNLFRKLADPFINLIVRNADACIAYGSVAKTYMVSVGAQDAKVFVANNTVDTQAIMDSPKDCDKVISEIRLKHGIQGQVVLYVGVIEKRKKVENLVSAFMLLQKMYDKPISLVVVGGGAHLNALRLWSLRNELSSNIYFMGEIIDDVGCLFSMCDVFVLPSEGGLALNQAMAYGKPVIATSADGTELDLIEDRWNGFIVEEDDIEQLAMAIKEVLQNSELQVYMGMNSLDKIRKDYTLATMVEKYSQALTYVVHAKYPKIEGNPL